MNISADHRSSFQNEGFLVLPGFLTKDELAAVCRACDSSVAAIEADMKTRGVTEDRINVLGKKYFILNARKQFSELMPIVFSEKTAAVCKATIGDEAYLHNEQFVVKMSDKATSFSWHQDSGYSVFQGGAARHKPYVTCWIALDDMSTANGTISILPFSRAPSRDLMEHTWEPSLNAMVGYRGDDPGDPVEVPAGTLVAFSSFLLHKSGANTTGKPRRSYFIAFTPTLFTHADESKGVYSSGEPLLKDGRLVAVL